MVFFWTFFGQINALVCLRDFFQKHKLYRPQIFERKCIYIFFTWLPTYLNHWIIIYNGFIEVNSLYWIEFNNSDVMFATGLNIL